MKTQSLSLGGLLRILLVAGLFGAANFSGVLWADEISTVVTESADIVINDGGKVKVLEKLKRGDKVKTGAKKGKDWIEVYLKKPQGKIIKGLTKASVFGAQPAKKVEKPSAPGTPVAHPLGFGVGYGLAMIGGNDFQTAIGLDKASMIASNIGFFGSYRLNDLFAFGLRGGLLTYSISFDGGTTIPITGELAFRGIFVLPYVSFIFLSGPSYDLELNAGAGMLLGTKVTTTLNSVATTVSPKSAIALDFSLVAKWFPTEMFGIYVKGGYLHTLPPAGYTTLVKGYEGQGGIAIRL